MQPLYFLPGLTKDQLAPQERLDRSVLRARGLADVFADCDYRDCLLNEPSSLGPGDKSGLYLTYQVPVTCELPRRTGYYPDEQEWHPVGDGSLLWIGIDKSSPPTAADMVRKRIYHGYYFTLADDQQWAVPVIRRPDGSTELPCDMVFDAAGNVVEPIKRAYVSYWEESADVAEWFFTSQGFDQQHFSKARALRLAIRALGLNYRYGVNEQNVVRAIDTLNWVSVLGATVDLPKMIELTEQKKSAVATVAEPSNTLPGPPVDSETTDPVAATCS